MTLSPNSCYLCHLTALTTAPSQIENCRSATKYVLLSSFNNRHKERADLSMDKTELLDQGEIRGVSWGSKVGSLNDAYRY